MLIPIVIPFASFPLNEKNCVLTKTPKSTAIALAELCHIFEFIYFREDPNENQDTIFLENVNVAARSVALNVSPVPSWSVSYTHLRAHET